MLYLLRRVLSFLLSPLGQFPIQEARSRWSKLIFSLKFLHQHFMPPLPPLDPTQEPRIVVYHQTHFRDNGSNYVPITPLLQHRTGVTHVIIAAIHLNDPAGHITLNDDPYDSPKLAVLWQDVKALQAGGIRVLGMLGGAAKGSYKRLDGAQPQFESFYAPLKAMVEYAGFDGLDLDVEEEMSLPGIVRLIDRLKHDFGAGFLITLAPVATALVGAKQLSGFSYFDLEKALGRHTAWYNTQFYCGWGSAETTEHYDAIMACGWPANKVVVGLVTNPGNGEGWVFEELLMATLAVLRDEYPGFGGVMGWEYFNSLSSLHEGEGKPWLWARGMSAILRPDGDGGGGGEGHGKGGGEEGKGGLEALAAEEIANTQNPFLQIVDQGKKTG